MRLDLWTGADGRWFTSGRYDPACPEGSPFHSERTQRNGTAFTACVERPQDCPDGYHAAGDLYCDPNVIDPPHVSPSNTVLPATTPTVTIGAIPTTLTGVPLGSISGSATDAVGVHRIRVVLRRNPDAAGACTAGVTKDWNGTAWVEGCLETNYILPPITPGVSVAWSVTNTPPLSTMIPANYRIYAGAYRSDDLVFNPAAPWIWSGWATKNFTYADATVSPVLSPSTIVSPTLSPTLSPSPTVSVLPVALTCAPVTQTVAIGQDAHITAVGGTGVYNWIALQNGAEATTVIQGGSVAVRYTVAGTFDVTVSSGTETKSCQVTVQTTQPAQASLTLTAAGRNVSTNGAVSDVVTALTGQQVELQMRVRNLSTAANLSGVILKAALPTGFSYIAGSTTIGGVTAAVDSVTAGGLSLNAIGPGQEVLVAFQATIAAAQFPVGVSQAQVVVQAQAPGAADLSDTVNFTITRPGSGTTGAVKTGPGEALLAAFLVSGIMTLLYVSYTHTSTYRRREVGAITDKRDPLDFRG